MSTQRVPLGRGLGSLIPGTTSGKQPYWGPTVNTVPQGESVMQLPVESVQSNPWQPRTHFDHDALEELASSIKEHGIIQPLVVTESAPGQYQLIAGERRLKAAKLVGLPSVPAVIRKVEDQEKLELSLIENLQRKNLNPVEEALGYKRLMDEFQLTQEDVAVRVGKSRSTIANILRVLTLPKDIIRALEEEQITFSHAKVILSYESEKDQLRALAHILKENLTVAQATQRSIRHSSVASPDPVLSSWQERLTQRLGFRVSIVPKAKGGTVQIPYKNDEDLKSLLDRLLRE